MFIPGYDAKCIKKTLHFKESILFSVKLSKQKKIL